MELQGEREAESDDLRLVLPALDGRPHPHPHHHEDQQQAYHRRVLNLLVARSNDGDPFERSE